MSPPLSVVVVDDEELARLRLRRLLSDLSDVHVVADCATGYEALQAVRSLHPDVLLLDVRMPLMDGFGVVGALAEAALHHDEPVASPFVIFVTAFDSHAVRAFDVHAVDYVLKPVQAERLREAMARVRGRLAEAHAARRYEALLAATRERTGTSVAEPPSPRPVRLLVRENHRVLLVAVADIDWIEADGNYARLHIGNRVYQLRETMIRLEGKLDPARFVRIHRSTIVNLDRVVEMQPWFSGEYRVLLRDGTALRLSRWYRDRAVRQATGGLLPMSR